MPPILQWFVLISAVLGQKENSACSQSLTAEMFVYLIAWGEPWAGRFPNSLWRCCQCCGSDSLWDWCL